MSHAFHSLRRSTVLKAGGLLLLLPIAARAGEAPLGIERRIDAYVEPYAHTRNFSGAILIARAGDVLVRKAYGMANEELSVPNTPETRFHVASVSKPFTAAAILLLEERGRLRVEDPVARFVPDYPNGGRITIHHLLTHTSGIPNVNDFPDYEERSRSAHTPEQLVRWFRARPLEFEPGARYAYSNSNYNLLAWIIERVSGEPYGEFLRRHIFEPLGMKGTGHHGDASTLIPLRASGYVPVGGDGLANAPHLDWSVKTGNGSLYSTVDDLYTWDRALRVGRILGPASREKMFKDHGHGAGYGWFIRKGVPRSVAITGRSPGFTTSLARFLEDDLTVVITANLYSGITHSMAPDLAAIALGEERQPLLAARPVAAPRESLARCVGRYRFGRDFFVPDVVAEVRMEDGGLTLDYPGAGASHLLALADDRFLNRLYGGILAFVRGADGKVEGLTWSLLGTEYRASRLP